LQEFVVAQEGQNLNLILDCKTRWNSIVPMVERVIKFKDCIKMAAKDFNQPFLSDTELNAVNELVSILKPVEKAVKVLSENNNNLLKAEGTLIYIFETELNRLLLQILKRQ
jgi:hypothetical protein